MGLSREDLTALLDAFEQYGWSEMSVTVNGTRLELTSSGRPPASGNGSAPGPQASAAPPAPAPAAEAATEPAAPASVAPSGPGSGLHDVLAPSVGIFYLAPEPGAPPFVEVGEHVAAEDVVCIVEVMKLMNHVKAGVDGVVRSVDAQNGTMIEYGQPLFTIERDA
jgi:acetyl-CoA carboxylase biotin carboxyl carrier protein